MNTFWDFISNQLSGNILFNGFDQGLYVVKTLFNLKSYNGSMLNHFENARISFNQNSEALSVYSLIVMVSFVIGTVAYFLLHSKSDKKQ